MALVARKRGRKRVRFKGREGGESGRKKHVLETVCGNDREEKRERNGEVQGIENDWR